jgi:hypothetical protein
MCVPAAGVPHTCMNAPPTQLRPRVVAASRLPRPTKHTSWLMAALTAGGRHLSRCMRVVRSAPVLAAGSGVGGGALGSIGRSDELCCAVARAGLEAALQPHSTVISCVPTPPAARLGAPLEEEKAQELRGVALNSSR